MKHNKMIMKESTYFKVLFSEKGTGLNGRLNEGEGVMEWGKG
jgi:hypothetical protein